VHRQLAIKLHSFESSALECCTYGTLYQDFPTCNKVRYGMMPMEFSVGQPREELRGFARAIGGD